MESGIHLYQNLLEIFTFYAFTELKNDCFQDTTHKAFRYCNKRNKLTDHSFKASEYSAKTYVWSSPRPVQLKRHSNCFKSTAKFFCFLHVHTHVAPFVGTHLNFTTHAICGISHAFQATRPA